MAAISQKLPPIERKAALRKILPKRDTGRVRCTEHIVGESEHLFQELERRHLEGMVAKRADSHNGLIFYPLVAIGGAILTVAAAVSFHFDQQRRVLQPYRFMRRWYS